MRVDSGREIQHHTSTQKQAACIHAVSHYMTPISVQLHATSEEQEQLKTRTLNPKHEPT
jgi:hypothetical protein